MVRPDQHRRQGPERPVQVCHQQTRTEKPERLEAAERRQRVGAAIGRLSAALKEVVTLRINAELEFREIAEMLNLPLGTVLARMHNAVAKLKQMILAETTRSDFNAETQSRAFQKDKNQNER